MATALITGSAKRIGAALAYALAKRGYNIALHCHRSTAKAMALAKEIRSLNVQCELFECDLAQPEAAANLIPEIHRVFRKDLTLLINNASLFKPSKLSTSDFHSLTDHFAIHLDAPYLLSCAFRTIKPVDGLIINILDTHIAANQSTHAAYLLSKKSLSDLTSMTALEFAPTIRVNAIAPGAILPPEDKGEDYMVKRVKKIPLRRSGRVDEILSAATFLLDNTFITGQTIFVDGGEHLI